MTPAHGKSEKARAGACRHPVSVLLDFKSAKSEHQIKYCPMCGATRRYVWGEGWQRWSLPFLLRLPRKKGK